MARATKPEPAAEPEVEAATDELPEASDRYNLYAEWLEEEVGLIVDPAALQVAVQNYGAFQRSDANKAANEERIASHAEQREERKVTAAEKKVVAEEKRKVRDTKAAERKVAAAEAAKEKAANAVKASAPTRRAASKTSPPAKAAPKPPAKRTTGKPRAARAASADRPF